MTMHESRAWLSMRAKVAINPHGGGATTPYFGKVGKMGVPAKDKVSYIFECFLQMENSSVLIYTLLWNTTQTVYY